MIKQNLLAFFQDRHIKVSLFIQEKIQGLDGTLNIFYTGTGPIFSQKPGTITYYSGGKVRDTDSLNIESSENYEENQFTKRMQGTTDPNLGLNMYAEKREPLCSRPKPKEGGKVDESQKPTIKKSKPKEETKEEKAQTEQEYNFLSKMIRGESDSQEKIKINFPGDIKPSATGGSGSEVPTINIDMGDSNIKKKETMMKEFDDMDVNQQDEVDDGDDLLDLMDS